jgi:hypothetical protein
MLRLGVTLRSLAERALGRRDGRWTSVLRRRADWQDGWQPGARLPGRADTDAGRAA